jgi:hypothetical protein
MNAGGGRLVDLSLHGVAAHVRSFGGDREAPQASVEEPIRPPRARPVRRRASKLGADGPRVLRELGIEC